MTKWKANELTSIVMPPTLATMVEENRLLHAINLEGDSEHAKMRLSYALAGAILCEKQNGAMCGRCLSCQKVIQGVHSDIVELSLANGAFKKDAIRTVRTEIYKSPSEGLAKIVILNNAQDMSVEVQNLLLKVIEEPPPDSYFIFTTINRYMLLDTILSRVVTISVPKLSLEASLEWLQSQIPDAGSQQCERALLLTNNCPEQALQILNDNTVSTHYEMLEKILNALVNEDRYSFLCAMVPAEKSRQEYLQVLTMLGTLMNNDIASKYGISIKKLIKLKTVINIAMKRCESNGYLQLISAAMLEEALEKKG